MSEEILTLEPVFYLGTNFNFHFIVIGVGGNGSELVPRLCRQIALRRHADSHATRHKITICDADIVEEKNLVRQNFFSSDLGKNKAEIMGLKCSTIFDIPVTAVTEYVETKKMLDGIVSLQADEDVVPFIIGCVDNNATRALIHSYVTDENVSLPIFYMDAGNEEFAGQVVLGAKLRRTDKASGTVGPDIYSFNLPFVANHHPEILAPKQDKFASQLSCAERAESNPQAAVTNLEAANIMFQMISNCLEGKIDYHYVSFDAEKSTRRVIFNTASTLKSYGIRGFSKEISTSTQQVSPVISSTEPHIMQAISLAEYSPPESINQWHDFFNTVAETLSL